MIKLICYIDGGSSGNPGPSAVGVVIKNAETKENIKTISSKIGIATNNEAEYMALIRCLEELRYLRIKGLDFDDFVINTDSMLVCRQMTGKWKIKQRKLQQLNETAQGMLMSLNVSYIIKHVKRDLNAEADKLVQNAKK